MTAMANPSKAKGTRFENEVLAGIRRIYPQADRAKSGNMSCDIVGTPFPVEAKNQKVFIWEWVRKVRRRALADRTGNRWALFFAHGDRRIRESAGTVVLVDPDFFHELLSVWEVDRHRAQRQVSDFELLRVDL